MAMESCDKISAKTEVLQLSSGIALLGTAELVDGQISADFFTIGWAPFHRFNIDLNGNIAS
jgi:hypothetical protein